MFRRVATCKPGKPGLTSFSETLAFFFIQFLSSRKMKVQEQTKWSLGLSRKKLAGYAPDVVVLVIFVHRFLRKEGIESCVNYLQ